MAKIGYLGTSAEEGIVFETSDSKLETPDNVVWSGSSRYATHQRHNTHALVEFTGMDPDKFTFDITFFAEVGVDPMGEAVKLWKYMREGTALQLLLGEHAYGKYRWVIKDLKIKAKYFDVHGNQYCTFVSVSLLEYLSKDF